MLFSLCSSVLFCKFISADCWGLSGVGDQSQSLRGPRSRRSGLWKRREAGEQVSRRCCCNGFTAHNDQPVLDPCCHCPRPRTVARSAVPAIAVCGAVRDVWEVGRPYVIDWSQLTPRPWGLRLSHQVFRVCYCWENEFTVSLRVAARFDSPSSSDLTR